MDSMTIALNLYSLVSDMDADDYSDTKDEEISILTSEIETLKTTGFVLYKALEMLTERSL